MNHDGHRHLPGAAGRVPARRSGTERRPRGRPGASGERERRAHPGARRARAWPIGARPNFQRPAGTFEHEGGWCGRGVLSTRSRERPR
ncbi:MAG: hypothetical protein MZW92_59070 [Comamonadaceae bacterium]|nr:hypothetical protein [Comamonadaceae bacterium]